MAVIDIIKSILSPGRSLDARPRVGTAVLDRSVRPLTRSHLRELVQVNSRCFGPGDGYTKYTFEYLLDDPRSLSYRIDDDLGSMAAFAFVMITDSGAGHLTTIGVLPEYRRRGLAACLIRHVERALASRGTVTLMLEVRVSNIEAQALYRREGFVVVQRINRYYNNGEDCFLMMKTLFELEK